MSNLSRQELLEELYAIDPALRSQAADIEAKIDVFLTNELPVSINPDFIARLRRELLQKKPQLSLINRVKKFVFNNFFMTRKKFVIGGAIVAALLLIVASTMRSSRALGAELAYTDGAVLYRTNGGVWQEAAPSTALKQGDGVKVIGEGKAVIMLDDGSAVRLNSDSEATLESLSPTHMRVINEHGQVYTRVVKSKERLFDVNVEGVTYRAMGTAYVTVNNNETQGVEVFHSAVKVISDTDPNSTTVVPEGSAYYDKNIEAPKKAKEITALSADEVKNNDFVNWNKDQDAADTKFDKQLGVLTLAMASSETATSTPTSTAAQGANTSTETTTTTAPAPVVTSIVLSKVGSNALSWTNPAGTGANGFKVVYSKNENPTYPPREGDKAIYVDVGTTIPWLYAFDGTGTYHVRVCDYKGNGVCGQYSNDMTIALSLDPGEQPSFSKEDAKVEIKAIKEETKEEIKNIKKEAKETEKEIKEAVKADKKAEKFPGPTGESTVKSITLIADSPEKGYVSWTTDGNLQTGMDRGVRVVFSKKPNPTYGESNALPVGYKNYSKIWAEDGTGTYYVRVCEFLGDHCGVYSNEVTVTIKGSGAGQEYFENGEWKSDRTANGSAKSSISSITVTANDPAPEHVSWTINGTVVLGMDRGMRVIFSRNPNPTLGASGTWAQPVGYKRYGKIWPKDGAGVYHVRVCEYLGNNTCGTYSNDVTVTVGEPGSSSEYKGSRMSEYKYSPENIGSSGIKND